MYWADSLERQANFKQNIIKMKLTERETIIIYAGLTNALIDHIDNDFRRNIFNKQSLKFKSNAVLKELESITDRLYSK